MCLILHKPAGVKVNEEQLLTAYNNNKDGFGVMIQKEGALKIVRKMPQSEHDVRRFLKTYLKEEDEVGMHFRYATHGNICKKNTHPVKVLSKSVDNYDLYMMHNGTFFGFKDAPNGQSDTIAFAQRIIRPVVKKYGPDILTDDIFSLLLKDYVGVSNKLMFMGESFQEPLFINKQAGNTSVIKDCWVSNTYSLEPAYRATKTHQNPVVLHHQNKVFNSTNATTYNKIWQGKSFKEKKDNTNVPVVSDFYGDTSYDKITKMVPSDLFKWVVQHPEDTCDLLIDLLVGVNSNDQS